MTYRCEDCGKEFSVKTSLTSHKGWCNNSNRVVWSKGLTKEIDDRLARSPELAKNFGDSGKTAMLNKHHTEKTRQQMRSSHLGKPSPCGFRGKHHTEERNRLVSQKVHNALLGRKPSLATRQLLSMRHKGENNANYGGGRLERCLVCGKEYWVLPSQIGKRKYCSTRCFGIDERGEKNHNWKGNECQNYPTEFENARIICLLRDWMLCRICHGDKGGLLVHHIDGDIYNNNLNNLVTLCRSCHGKLHQGKIPLNFSDLDLISDRAYSNDEIIFY